MVGLCRMVWVYKLDRLFAKKSTMLLIIYYYVFVLPNLVLQLIEWHGVAIESGQGNCIS